MSDSLPSTTDDWAFFLDIDGTLIDIAPTPDAVVVPHDLPGILDRLSQRTGGALALLTGRDLDTVDRLFAPFTLPAGAIHGTQLRFADGEVAIPSESPALAGIRERLGAFVAGRPGMLLEDKGTALAVHFRADPTAHDAVEREVRDAAAAGGADLTVQPGKAVFEIRPAHADKGRALATFMDSPAFAGRRPVAIGDDVTDESMFAEATRRGGQAFRVGAAQAGSFAHKAFDDPAGVRAWLAGLAA
ncbi:trehalose-phosphatase [Bauldia litoralis]|uniref:Trehalose 6-phosphate phosphatase n=1 Tax=Bauldia litoralis TaxID=665467 RepID=A0A1G6BJC0_9HYPH|nr:trehalose-phosphatase [Bauldia litoralis]SDB20687.1 trehalose 6-phosphate phosphatase [Bauldia litoralis]